MYLLVTVGFRDFAGLEVSLASGLLFAEEICCFGHGFEGDEVVGISGVLFEAAVEFVVRLRLLLIVVIFCTFEVVRSCAAIELL